MSNSIKYIESVEEVIEIHKKTIMVSGGGTYGVLNLHSLEACLTQIQNDMYYPTFEDKLTHFFLLPIKAIPFRMEINALQSLSG